MKKILVLALSTLAGFSPVGQAALSPVHESIAEITDLLSDSRLSAMLGQYAITKIRRISSGYLIGSIDCEIHVEINYIVPKHNWAGPAQYEFIFPNDVACPR